MYPKNRGFKIRELTPLDKEYPERLRNIPRYPTTLYVRGTLPDDETPTIAIIGARDASEHGLDIARSLSSVLSQHGIAIISGLAYGIDTKAHQGAIGNIGKTYAVLGCGLDICYPPSNFRLSNEILATGGGLISELPPSSPPLGRHFASRNRIIAGLADAVIVVEAKLRSGTSITVSNALEQGKQVFAVPGRITDRLSEGCNQLIKDGASILCSSTDILEFFDLEKKKCQSVILASSENLSKEQSTVLNLLSDSSIHIEKLSALSKLSTEKLSELLLDLELRELIECPKSGYYRRKLPPYSL